MRNPNGYGSIFKLSGKRRKPWVVVKTIKLTDDGKQKRAVLGTFETRPEANDFLVEYNRNPYDVSTKDITFYEVYELFFEYNKAKVSESTKRGYQSNIKTFKPLFGIPIREVKLQHLQYILDNCDNSYGSISIKRALCFNIFNYALKRELVNKNYAELTEINKKNENIISRKIFTNEEVEILWKELRNPGADTSTIEILLTMIYSGMRIGELIDLKIEDIITQNCIKSFNITKSKTSNGIRVIPIHDRLIEIIEKNMSFNKVYLFETKTHKKLNYNNWRPFKFNVLMQNLCMNHTIHDCRHTLASRLTDNEVNPIIIRKIMGHSGKGVTETVYIHLTIENLKKAISTLI